MHHTLKRYKLLFIAALFFFNACRTNTVITEPIYKSEDLVIHQLSAHVYVHTSFLMTDTFGKVPCNGMIYEHSGEVVIVDTPASDEVSIELINWVQEVLGKRIVGIVPTHFHEDCLAGLATFHDRNIPSYAHHITIQHLDPGSEDVPQNGFDETKIISIGNGKLECTFHGEGHTVDNITCYVPTDKVLFGGCLIKSLGAGKGNLADANDIEWPKTVSRVRQAYPEVEIVIPGHGSTGGPQLLDFTIELFSDTNNR